MRLEHTSKVRCCIPCCCLNPGDPDSIAHWILIWDFFVFLLVILFDLWYIDTFGYIPLVFNLFYIAILFFVVYDLRHPENNLQLTSCFNYFRAVASAALIIGAIASLILTFILIADPSREGEYFSWRWFLFYFFIATMTAIVQISTVFKLGQSIKVLKSTNSYDTHMNQLGISLTQQKSLGMLNSSVLMRSDLMDNAYKNVYSV